MNTNEQKDGKTHINLWWQRMRYEHTVCSTLLTSIGLAQALLERSLAEEVVIKVLW